MSAQPQSPLLSLPAELRRDILTRALTPAPGLHLFLHDGRPRVSPCLGARLVGEDSCERRVPFKLGVTTQERQDEWVRRLESKWANHYMCEEVRDGRVFSDHPAKRGYMYALLVCKQMMIECTEIIGPLLEVTVTDFETALYFTRLGNPETPPPKPDASLPPIPLALLRSARSLNLSLYEKYKFYLALSLPGYTPPGWTPTGESHGISWGYERERTLEAVRQAGLWGELCAALVVAPHLARVTLWLDSSAGRWSGMDERRILSPLLVAAARLSGTAVEVYLPDIPFGEIRRAKHFLADDGPPLPLRVRRSNRRRPTEHQLVAGDEEDTRQSPMRRLRSDWGV